MQVRKRLIGLRTSSACQPLTLSLVLEEVVDLAGRSVERDDVEALVVHVEDQVLTLGDGVNGYYP